MSRSKEHNPNKLTLHTETLRHLSASHLAQARGGLDGDTAWADGGDGGDWDGGGGGWEGFDWGNNDNWGGGGGGGGGWTFWDNEGGM